MQACKRGTSGTFLTKKPSKGLDNIKIFNKRQVNGNNCSIEVKAESNISFSGSVGSGNVLASSPKDVNSDDFSTSTCSWREGRRICELGYLYD